MELLKVKKNGFVLFSEDPGTHSGDDFIWTTEFLWNVFFFNCSCFIESFCYNKSLVWPFKYQQNQTIKSGTEGIPVCYTLIYGENQDHLKVKEKTDWKFEGKKIKSRFKLEKYTFKTWYNYWTLKINKLETWIKKTKMNIKSKNVYLYFSFSLFLILFFYILCFEFQFRVFKFSLLKKLRKLRKHQ